MERLRRQSRKPLFQGRTPHKRDDLLGNPNHRVIVSTLSRLHQSGRRTLITEAAKGWIGSTTTPAGIALFPKDIAPPPREWANRFYSVQCWTEMPRGGHFAALEQPELPADDIRAFFRPLRQIS
jgi:hypothetical protein